MPTFHITTDHDVNVTVRAQSKEHEETTTPNGKLIAARCAFVEQYMLFTSSEADNPDCDHSIIAILANADCSPVPWKLIKAAHLDEPHLFATIQEMISKGLIETSYHDRQLCYSLVPQLDDDDDS